MRKVFLDVGANSGQSVEAARCYDFDIIYCFEPVPEHYNNLMAGKINSDRGAGYQVKHYYDERAIICPYGLWSENKEMTLYSPHTLASSVFQDHPHGEGGTVLGKFVNVAEWFKENIKDDDVVIMKLNCEGAECTILETLINSNDLRRVANVMIDFDANKIPSQKHAPNYIIGLLVLNDYHNYVMCDNVMQGPTHFDRICNWLNGTGLVKYIYV